MSPASPWKLVRSCIDMEHGLLLLRECAQYKEQDLHSQMQGGLQASLLPVGNHLTLSLRFLIVQLHGDGCEDEGSL